MNKRLPPWFKQELPDETTLALSRLLAELRVNTVCKEASCPNLTQCFNLKQLTFMVLGDKCTRGCRFCGVKKEDSSVLGFDHDEPYRINQAVRLLGLSYVVITSVTRDDLTDGGAGVFAETVRLIYQANPGIKVELLIPDFSGNTLSLKTVADSGPVVVGHNIETVESLYGLLKPESNYRISLGVLTALKEINPALLTKSSLILGLGETEDQVLNTMADLRNSSCDILTLGQYLAPSEKHYPIREFIPAESFARYRTLALDMGFKSVLSGPLVRGSYQAQNLYEGLLACTIQ